MENLHLLSTDKPSRFSLNSSGKYHLTNQLYTNSPNFTNQHIYITNSEEIKEKDWVVENHTFEREPYIGKCFYPKNDGTVTDEILKRDLLSVKYEGHYETIAHKHNCKKIILTTDQDLIKDGVQSIDDEFLEWFVKNPSCESVEVVDDLKYFNIDELRERHIKGLPHLYSERIGYKIIIPKEEPNARWISVNENKPNNKDKVIVSCEHGVTMAEYTKFDNGNETWWAILCFGTYEDGGEAKQVTHWMPLPNADKITTASTTSAKIENKTLWKEMYSEEDMKHAFFSGCQSERQIKPRVKCWEEFIEQFKNK